MNYDQGDTRIATTRYKLERNKISKKKNQMRPKEERREIQPNGPDVYETEEDRPVIVPRSEIHIHSVTLGESLESIEN